jgi:hypothetical protein
MASNFQQNGTMAAHGHVWPIYERAAFSVDVVGSIDADSVDSAGGAEVIAAELRAVLDKYGVGVKVSPVAVDFMSSEDQAEKDTLDEQAIKREGI